jgi:hypothetical protein
LFVAVHFVRYRDVDFYWNFDRIRHWFLDRIWHRFVDGIRHVLLDGHRVRAVYWYFNRIGYGFFDGVRDVFVDGYLHGVRLIDKHLNGIRDVLDDFVRYTFLDVNSVWLGYVNCVRFVDWIFDFVRDLLVDYIGLWHVDFDFVRHGLVDVHRIWLGHVHWIRAVDGYFDLYWVRYAFFDFNRIRLGDFLDDRLGDHSLLVPVLEVLTVYNIAETSRGVTVTGVEYASFVMSFAVVSYRHRWRCCSRRRGGLLSLVGLRLRSASD